MRHRVMPEIVDFAARDRFGLNFHHYPSIGSGNAEPVIVVHGAGVRANLFRRKKPLSMRCWMRAAMSGF